MRYSLTCRSWSTITKYYPYAKSELLMIRYGKECALLHAARLRFTFIDITMCQVLIARKVTIPGYFIYRSFELRMNENLSSKSNLPSDFNVINHVTKMLENDLIEIG